MVVLAMEMEELAADIKEKEEEVDVEAAVGVGAGEPEASGSGCTAVAPRVGEPTDKDKEWSSPAVGGEEEQG